MCSRNLSRLRLMSSMPIEAITWRRFAEDHFFHLLRISPTDRPNSRMAACCIGASYMPNHDREHARHIDANVLERSSAPQRIFDLRRFETQIRRSLPARASRTAPGRGSSWSPARRSPPPPQITRIRLLGHRLYCLISTSRMPMNNIATKTTMTANHPNGPVGRPAASSEGCDMGFLSK